MNLETILELIFGLVATILATAALWFAFQNAKSKPLSTIALHLTELIRDGTDRTGNDALEPILPTHQSRGRLKRRSFQHRQTMYVVELATMEE